MLGDKEINMSKFNTTEMQWIAVMAAAINCGTQLISS